MQRHEHLTQLLPGCQHWSNDFGYLRAAEIILLERPFDAAHAAALGMVTRVVPDAEVLATAQKTALELAKKPAAAFPVVAPADLAPGPSAPRPYPPELRVSSPSNPMERVPGLQHLRRANSPLVQPRHPSGRSCLESAFAPAPCSSTNSRNSQQ
jgi:Enoyl-CoA hydratase/isomerase